jgi:ribosomal protein S18 acetylase RimI-like enzyme
MGGPSPKPIRESEQSKAVATLVSAFIIDPVQRWLFPTSEDYLTHFPMFAVAFGGKAFDAATAWQLGEFSAAALWLPPGTEPDGDAIVAVLSESVAPGKHGECFAVLEQMEVAHPKYAHWYLPWLGVDSAMQETGLGTQLMNLCLATVDEDCLPAFLETPNPRNISFYERHGFEVTAVSQDGTCPPVTSMLRAAH